MQCMATMVWKLRLPQPRPGLWNGNNTCQLNPRPQTIPHLAGALCREAADSTKTRFSAVAACPQPPRPRSKTVGCAGSCRCPLFAAKIRCSKLGNKAFGRPCELINCVTLTTFTKPTGTSGPGFSAQTVAEASWAHCRVPPVSAGGGLAVAGSPPCGVGAAGTSEATPTNPDVPGGTCGG